METFNTEISRTKALLCFREVFSSISARLHFPKKRARAQSLIDESIRYYRSKLRFTPVTTPIASIVAHPVTELLQPNEIRMGIPRKDRAMVRAPRSHKCCSNAPMSRSIASTRRSKRSQPFSFEASVGSPHAPVSE